MMTACGMLGRQTVIPVSYTHLDVYKRQDCYILPGIARRHLIDQCGVLGIPVDETPFTLEELMAADEVIVSSSSTLCIQAVEIDGKPVGGKDPVRLGRIRSAVYQEFNDFMNG